MYNPVVGRWISRDPLAQAERGTANGVPGELEPEIVHTHEYVAKGCVLY
jgi:hypothetical protein